MYAGPLTDPSLPSNRLPIEHSSAEISAVEGKRDPFLYNPRTRAAEAGKVRLKCQKGRKRADQRLSSSPMSKPRCSSPCKTRSPLIWMCRKSRSCKCDICALACGINGSTTGVSFVTNPHPIALASGGFQTVRLSGVATTPGSLEIRGVTLRLKDGSTTNVLLPSVSEKDQSKRDKRKSRVLADAAKSKRQGMEARWSMTSHGSGQFDLDRKASMSAATKWLECKVVEEQPVVWIKKTSLTHGTVMLYNGET